MNSFFIRNHMFTCYGLVTKLCPTLKTLFLRNIGIQEYSLPGSSVHGILQAGMLEWVAFSSPGDLSNSGIEPRSPASQADSLPTELQWKSQKAECQRIDAFELWCWRRILRIPWTTRRSNQSILKEISPDYSLEGLMLKLKLQYFGHLFLFGKS